MSATDATSWTLIRRAAAGSAADKESFAERYGPVLGAYLAARWRLPRDHDRVQDTTQEVFVQCFKEDGALSKAKPDEGGGFRAFLYGVAKNVAAMQERSRRRRSQKERQADTGFDLEQVHADEASLSHVFDRAWARMITKEARQLLVRRSQGSDWLTALELRYREKLPPREIATRLDMEVNRVYELLRKAKHEYRMALLEIVAVYNPEAEQTELEQRCIDLLASL